MKKIGALVFSIALCLAVAFIFPQVGRSNLYVDSSSECLTCHVATYPPGSEGEQHYDHDGKKNPNTGEDIVCTDCHEGTPATGNVKAHTCTVCHLEKCESINTHESQHGADCLSCHPECAADTTTTTTAVSSTTTTATDPCAAEEIYGEDSEEVEILRYLRDNVLSATPEGQEIIRLYYQWAPVLTIAIQNDEEVRAEIKALVDGILLLITE